MSLVYLDPSNLPAMDESSRQAVNHLKNAIDQRTILPMVHGEQRLREDGSLNVVPAFVDAMTTRNVELLLDAVRTVTGQVVNTNSEGCYCRCADLYAELDTAKLTAIQEFAKAKPTSKNQAKGVDILNTRLAEIDKQRVAMFGDEIPASMAISAADPPCKFCGKPHRLLEWAAFTEPSFVQNLFKLVLGGEFPLNYLPLLLEAIDSWIYNEDVIPPAKKKRVEAVLEKMGFFAMKEQILSKLTGFITGEENQTLVALMQRVEDLRDENARLITLTASSSAAPNGTPDVTATSPTPSDSPRPLLTNDLAPELSGSFMSSTLKPDEN